MDKERELREWCAECVFNRIKMNNKNYLVSKSTSPSELQCIECMYKLLKYGSVIVRKPKNWNIHERKIET